MNNNKTLILLTGFACNNNCVMCSLESFKQRKTNRTTKELILEIERGKKKDFERVEFTGGEPGIRKDIFQLIKYANDLGFKKIGMSTNGRIFYYPEFCQEFVKAGLNRVNISLYGHTPKLHNAITRTPKAFEQTLQGIKNIQKYSSVTLELNTVVLKINFPYLKQIGSFVLRVLGIQRWAVIDLIPDGNALPLYNSLSVKLTDLSRNLSDFFQTLPKGIQITFFDFPLCLFPPSIRNLDCVSFVVAKERNQIAEQRGYYPTRIKKIGDRYTDKHKVRVPICNDCMFDFRCGGVWKKYIDLYGEDEINTLVEAHNVIKGNGQDR